MYTQHWIPPYVTEFLKPNDPSSFMNSTHAYNEQGAWIKLQSCTAEQVY